jgi:hypothetical protein
VDAGVDQLVVDDEIAAGGERRKKCVVGQEAAREVEAGFGAKEGRRLGFERLVLGIVAAQEPSVAWAHRDTARSRRHNCLGQLRRGGKAEIVVRGEVDAGGRPERSQASAPLERLQRPLVAV